MGVRRTAIYRTGIKKLAREPDFVDGTTKTAANMIASRVRQIASSDLKSLTLSRGGYKRKIRTTVEVDADGTMFGRVHADDIAAHIIEWGGGHTPAYAPLRRAAEDLGLLTPSEPAAYPGDEAW